MESSKKKEYKLMNEIEVFLDLKKRIELTRRARIQASKRLRKKHELYEKITYFYSVLILVLSIWFIGDFGSDIDSSVVTKILLILSLSLTFFTMYINIKNYKERASAFESNYMSLEVLFNKVERMGTNVESITEDSIKELHREYEKLLLEKENHLDIDYMKSSKEKEFQYVDRIKMIERIEFYKNITVLLYPFILLGIIYLSYEALIILNLK
jgi:hypothetical protein